MKRLLAALVLAAFAQTAWAKGDPGPDFDDLHRAGSEIADDARKMQNEPKNKVPRKSYDETKILIMQMPGTGDLNVTRDYVIVKEGDQEKVKKLIGEMFAGSRLSAVRPLTPKEYALAVKAPHHPTIQKTLDSADMSTVEFFDSKLADHAVIIMRAPGMHQ